MTLKVHLHGSVHIKLIIIAKPLSQIRFVSEMDEDLKGEFSKNETNNGNLQKKTETVKT